MPPERVPDRPVDGPGEFPEPHSSPSNPQPAGRVLSGIAAFIRTTFLFALAGAMVGNWIPSNQQEDWGPAIGLLIGGWLGAVGFLAYRGIRAARRSQEPGRWIPVGVGAVILVIWLATELGNL